RGVGSVGRAPPGQGAGRGFGSRLPLPVRPQTASNYGCQLGRGNGIGAASEGALEASRANANDRLPRASLGWVEGRDGIVEGRDVADVRPQSSVPQAVNDLTQLGTIGLDDEVDREAVSRPRLGWPDD